MHVFYKNDEISSWQGDMNCQGLYMCHSGCVGAILTVYTYNNKCTCEYVFVRAFTFSPF